MRSVFLKGLSLALLTCGAAIVPAYADEKPHSYLVFFDFDKAELTPQALKIIDSAASDIAAGKPTKIQVTGYTDTVGSEDYNLALSRRRAAAVEAALSQRGVPSSDIAVLGKGKHDLLVNTANGVREPQNRRASIVYSVPEQEAAAPPPEAPAAAAPAETPPAAPPGFGMWAQAETGITGNFNSPKSGLNSSHLFTDKANQVLLNQVLLTAERPIDPKATDYDWSYRLQGMYGSDARYTHFLGELDNAIKNDRNQVDVVEAWVNLHTPWLTDGGMDIKVGQYVTYLGADTIDPSGSVFYSKNYIFNYGIPLKHTGAMVITHVSDTLDIYTGIDTGDQTTFGEYSSGASFQGGFGLNNLADGKLTILALTHVGPLSPVDNSTLYQNDILFTFKASDTLTSLTELNYVRAQGPKASAYGVSETLSYALNAEWTVSGRAEIFDDDNGFFVAAFPGNQDFVLAEKGNPRAVVISTPGRTTYAEVTIGASYKPDPAGLGPFQAVTFRPEIRYDGSLNNTLPFDINKNLVGTKTSQMTIGLDLILKI